MKLGQCFHAFFLSVVYTNVGPWRVNNKWEKKKGKAGIVPVAISKVWVSIKLISQAFVCDDTVLDVFYFYSPYSIFSERKTPLKPTCFAHFLCLLFINFLSDSLFIDWCQCCTEVTLENWNKMAFQFLERRSILKLFPSAFS